MIIGYARISTSDQTTHLQEDSLKAAGCERIFADTMSGSTTQRPGLDQTLGTLRAGDTLVIWKLDRLGRSLRHLVELAALLRENRIELRSLTEGIDTTTPGGQLVFHIFAALAQFEREIIKERVQAGLEAAAARGRKGGRPSVVKPSTKKAIGSMIAAGLTSREICDQLKISRATFFRHRPQD